MRAGVPCAADASARTMRRCASSILKALSPDGFASARAACAARLKAPGPAVDPTSAGWFGRILKGAPVDPWRPILFADHRTPPTLIVQGEGDTLTPVELSKRFCAKVDRPDAPCIVKTYPKLGHYFTRTLKDQDGQFDPFVTESDAQTEIDKAATEDSRKQLVEFMASRTAL